MKTLSFNVIKNHDEHTGAHKIVTTQRRGDPHRHDFVELIYICAGTGTQYIDGVAYEVSRGDFLYVNYGKTHDFLANGSMTYIEVMFDLFFLSRELINSKNAFDILSLTEFSEFHGDISGNPDPIVTFTGQERQAVEHILEDIIEELRCKKSLYKNVVRDYIEALFLKMIRKLSSADHQEYYDKSDVMRQMLEYIQNNFSADLTLETLAEKCFYSPAYFSRVFKEKFGMGFKSYTQQLRTKKAVELLQTTNMPIKTIISYCGFHDKNSFYRATQKFYGATPTALRKAANTAEPDYIFKNRP